jgi:FlaG/FlaF family flagellin (archaellin)
MRKMNKRAIAPITATILLLTVSILIGAIAMNIGKKYSAAEETPVQESSIVISINDVLGDELKELQLKYITGKITREEYVEKEKLILSGSG